MSVMKKRKIWCPSNRDWRLIWFVFSGRYYQLRCVDVVVEMEATKAIKEGKDQGDD